LHLQKHCIENFRSLETKSIHLLPPKQKGRHYKTKYGTESSVLVRTLEVHVIKLETSACRGDVTEEHVSVVLLICMFVGIPLDLF
jgi:hypothetical protein